MPTGPMCFNKWKIRQTFYNVTFLWRNGKSVLIPGDIHKFQSLKVAFAILTCYFMTYFSRYRLIFSRFWCWICEICMIYCIILFHGSQVDMRKSEFTDYFAEQICKEYFAQKHYVPNDFNWCDNPYFVRNVGWSCGSRNEPLKTDHEMGL